MYGALRVKKILLANSTFYVEKNFEKLKVYGEALRSLLIRLTVYAYAYRRGRDCQKGYVEHNECLRKLWTLGFQR